MKLTTASFARSLFIAGILAIVSTSAEAQGERASAAQVDQALKQQPELLSGFTTPEGNKAKVLRAVPGGVLLEFEGNDGMKGTIDVVGPPSVMTKGFLDQVVDIGKKIIGVFTSVVAPVTGTGSGAGKNCGNVEITVEGGENKTKVGPITVLVNC